MFRNRAEFACALEALERCDFAAADAQLSALLERLPLPAAERAFLLNKRGVARIGLQRRDDARADFNAALQARPAYAPSLTNLGNLRFEAGDPLDAIAHYERAIASDAEYALAYFNLGSAYKKVGRLAEGVRALRQAQRLEGRATTPRSFRRPRSR